MADALKVRIDRREFDRTLRQYVIVSKRDIPSIVNTKAFFIARRAVVETPKANSREIRKLMSRKTGAILGKLVNKRRGGRGENGLYGDAMAVAVGLIVAARLRSVAFLKSGWLPAVKALERVVDPKWRRGAARKDKAAKVFGKDKGSAEVARAGWSVHATIENAAGANRDNKSALEKHGIPALQRAFDFETASMLQYIEKRMKASAQSAGIRIA